MKYFNKIYKNNSNEPENNLYKIECIKKDRRLYINELFLTK